MTRSRLPLGVTALAMGMALVPAAAGPVWAAPQDTVEGRFFVTEFEIGREESTGPVGRLWFELTARSLSDGLGDGTFSERQECLQRGDLLHCRGVGTATGDDGSSGKISSRVTCTLTLACEGRSVFVGVDGDGRPLVYTSVISAPGDGTGTFIATIRTP